MATYHTDLSGNGPGVMLRDILRDEDRVAATVAVITALAPDVLALQDVDYDHGAVGLGALIERLAADGVRYPHHVMLRPNSGWPTGHDLDGDGQSDGPRDAHGYGRFNGAGGIAVLSRYPIGAVEDFSELLWADLPDSEAPGVTPAEALDTLRLHSVAAWSVEIESPAGPLMILTSHASPPVFDGPEDRNGRRNADEVRFWVDVLEGLPADGAAAPVYMGTLNVDPEAGEGRRDALMALLTHPRLIDPRPESAFGLATADWAEPSPGNLRVDYVLPSASLRLGDTGVFWPETGPLADAAGQASDHRMVWIDILY